MWATRRWFQIHVCVIVMANVCQVTSGCGPGDPNGTARLLNSGEPVVTGVVPTQLTVGHEVQILGHHFCGSQESCRPRVAFEGTFQGPAGAEAVQIEAQGVTYKNDGTLSWTFGPNVPFSARGQVGSFSGTVRVFNEGAGGTQSQGSAPYQVQLVVGPSILIRRMGPVEGNCGAEGLTDTTENTSLMIEVEAAGLQPGRSGAPIIVSYSFSTTSFALEGRFQDRFNSNPEQVAPTNRVVTLVDRVESGSASTLGGSATARMRLLETGLPSTNSGSELFDYWTEQLPSIDHEQRFALNGLRTGALLQKQTRGTAATIAVQAVDSAGNIASRTLALRIWPLVELKTGERHKVRDSEPEAVSGCIYAGINPGVLRYSEQSTKTQQRSLDDRLIVKPQFGIATSILQGLVTNHAQVEAELGIQLDKAVSSAEMEGLELESQLYPGQVAMIYRQLTQYEQRLDAVVHNACGHAEDAGYLVLTDWVWGRGVGIANQPSCDPQPRTKLVATDDGSKFLGPAPR